MQQDLNPLRMAVSDAVDFTLRSLGYQRGAMDADGWMSYFKTRKEIRIRVAIPRSNDDVVVALMKNGSRLRSQVF